MFIELVDALRCPAPHEESWLVVSTTRLQDRHVREGRLGCPVCRAEYPIERGIADFRARGRSGDGIAPPEQGAGEPVVDTGSDPADAMRLAAMMNLGDALGFAVLVGEWGRVADGLLALGEMPPLLLVDPPPGVEMRRGTSGVRCGASVPLADGAARSVAVDAARSHLVPSAVRAVRAGGRIVGTATIPLPDGVHELARDAGVWVGERERSASGLVSLHVRRARG